LPLHKILDGGQRHVVAYLIPGDFCDLHTFIPEEAMDPTIGTLSQCKVVGIPRHRVLGNDRGPARDALVGSLVDEAILREWLLKSTSAPRPTEQRVAHLEMLPSAWTVR